MFERFTNRARHAVVLAQEEARRLQHNYIGTEHILLGLLGEPEGYAARVLAGFGITREGAREEVRAIVGAGNQRRRAGTSRSPRGRRRPLSSRCARRCSCTTTTSAPSTSCSA